MLVLCRALVLRSRLIVFAGLICALPHLVQNDKSVHGETHQSARRLADISGVARRTLHKRIRSTCATTACERITCFSSHQLCRIEAMAYFSMQWQQPSWLISSLERWPLTPARQGLTLSHHPERAPSCASVREHPAVRCRVGNTRCPTRLRLRVSRSHERQCWY